MLAMLNSAEETICSIFNLSKREFAIFRTLRELANVDICVKYLTIQAEKDRSVVQRALKNLLENDLIIPKEVSLSEFKNSCAQNPQLFAKLTEEERAKIIPKTSRGYLKLYRAIDDDQLMELIGQRLEQWKYSIVQYLEGDI